MSETTPEGLARLREGASLALDAHQREDCREDCPCRGTCRLCGWATWPCPSAEVAIALPALIDALEAERAKVAAVERAADRLAASVMLLAHDAHPVYGSTAGWRGGIGSQALTWGCSIIDPPPGVEWTQLDLPTTEAREWIKTRDVDIDGIKADLRAEWTAALGATEGGGA